MAFKKLQAVITPIPSLSPKKIDRMFEIFTKYYEQVDYEKFFQDLQKKNHAILLLDRKTRIIQGFSTIVCLSLDIDHKKVFGAFSGDTIIEKEYWGQSALQIAFLKYLWKEKLRRPFSEYYWFLISKGYKTYLLMANNFAEHYPRYEKPCPLNSQQILSSFARYLYPENYDEISGLIKFPSDNSSHLSNDVAPIDEQLLKNPRVAFFLQKNPTWEQGTELACIAKMTWTMPLKYFLKSYWKIAKRKWKICI